MAADTETSQQQLAEIERAPEELREVYVSGRRVRFRVDFPARESYDLPKRMAAVAAGGEPHMDQAGAFLVMVVEDWGFDGDPHIAASYGDMGIFALTILTNKAVEYITALLQEVERIPPK